MSMKPFVDWKETARYKASLLHLPIDGTTYTIEPIGWRTLETLDEEYGREQGRHAMSEEERAADLEAHPRMSNETLQQLILGEALAEMRANNVPARAIVHATAVAYLDAKQGREAAELLWDKGPNQIALAAALLAEVQPEAAAKPATRPRRKAVGK